IKIEFGAKYCVLAAIGVNESKRHVLAAQMHVRHEPNEFGILREREFAFCLPIRVACRNRFARVNEGIRRHDDESSFRRRLSRREAYHRLILSFFSVRRVMDLEPDRCSAPNQFRGVMESEIEWGASRRIYGFHGCESTT